MLWKGQSVTTSGEITDAIENFEPDPTPGGGTVAKKPYTQDFFGHDFFRTAPAMAALKGNSDPKPEHLRACLMELTRYVLRGSNSGPKKPS